MGGYLRAMRLYGVFQGRAARAEFWQFATVAVGFSVVALFIDTATGQGTEKSPGGVLTALVVLAHLLPALIVTVRRLHDTDRTGWMVLLNYIPPLNLIIVVLACLRGTPGPNHYGPDPLDPSVAAVGSIAPAARAMPAVAPPAAAPGRVDVIAELERLGRLRREGHPSEAEFEVMKAETLAQARR